MRASGIATEGQRGSLSGVALFAKLEEAEPQKDREAEGQKDRGAEPVPRSSLFAPRSAIRDPRSWSRCRGVVLVLVLGAVAILTILAVEVAHRAGLSASASARAGREGVFDRAFQSGLAVAQALLSEGRSGQLGFDYLGDAWSKTVEIEPEAGVKVRVSVSDEAGKLNIASTLQTDADALQTKQALRRLFEFLRSEGSVRSVDWGRVEKALLERLGLGEKKDGEKQGVAPLLTLDGLREAGLSRELVFGPLDRSQEPDAVALADLLTVSGKGRVNLNTASKAVFYSFDPEFDAGQVERIAMWRGDGHADPRPFRRVDDLTQVEGILVVDNSQNPPIEVRNLLRNVQGRVAVQSGYFSARLVVECQGKVREGWGFFEIPQALPGTALQAVAGQGVILTGFEEIEP
jgi:hypothetical protein